jgi:hypothetical protein
MGPLLGADMLNRGLLALFSFNGLVINGMLLRWQ